MNIIFKDKVKKKSHSSRNQGFSNFFLLGDRRIQIRIRIHTSDWWIRIQEAQKHVDPDPQHCFKDNKSFRSHKVTGMALTDPEHWLHHILLQN
jgi:hypothetical protein